MRKIPESEIWKPEPESIVSIYADKMDWVFSCCFADNFFVCFYISSLNQSHNKISFIHQNCPSLKKEEDGNPSDKSVRQDWKELHFLTGLWILSMCMFFLFTEQKIWIYCCLISYNCFNPVLFLLQESLNFGILLSQWRCSVGNGCSPHRMCQLCPSPQPSGRGTCHLCQDC